MIPSDGREGETVIQLGELVMILDLHRQGLSVTAIARRVGIDRKTVRKYIERGLEPPSYGPRQPRARRLEPFEAYLRQRVVTYPGGTVRNFVRRLGMMGAKEPAHAETQRAAYSRRHSRPVAGRRRRQNSV